MNRSAPYANAATLRKEHDQILFSLAYPSDKKELVKAREALSRISQQKIRNPGSKAVAGLPGSVINGSFSYALACWLNKRFPQDTEIESSGADAEMARLLFRLILPRCEYESISTGELDLMKRIQLLKGKSSGSMLSWLLEQMTASGISEQTKETLFHSLQLFIRCTISDPSQQLSMLRGPDSPVGFHRMIRKKISLPSFTRKKIPAPRILTEAEKQNLIDTARASLFFLYRETEPFTYADPDGLVYFELEKGLGIALYGMIPERKLSIESYIGYLAFSNGIPVAYGGGWLFGERCQFGINIFPSFRGGPSSLLLAQLIRVYHQYFQVNRFVIKPYQFGRKNPEAIKTGAFWFYYKAGFRPEDRELFKMAKEEDQKKQVDKKYRSSEKILRRLTASPLFLSLSKDAFPDYDATLLSKRVTRFIQTRYGNNRMKAIRDSSRKLRLVLGDPGLQHWTPSEKKALEEWSLILQSTIDWKDWKAKDKRKLLALIRSKGKGPETEFIRQFRQLGILWEQWDQTFLRE